MYQIGFEGAQEVSNILIRLTSTTWCFSSFHCFLSSKTQVPQIGSELCKAGA